MYIMKITKEIGIEYNYIYEGVGCFIDIEVQSSKHIIYSVNKEFIRIAQVHFYLVFSRS